MSKVKKDKKLRQYITEEIQQYSKLIVSSPEDDQNVYNNMRFIFDNLAEQLPKKKISKYEIYMEEKIIETVNDMKDYKYEFKNIQPNISLLDMHFDLISDMVRYLRKEGINLKSKEFKDSEKAWGLTKTLAEQFVGRELASEEGKKRYDVRIKEIYDTMRLNDEYRQLLEDEKVETAIEEGRVVNYREFRAKIKIVEKKRRENLKQKLKIESSNEAHKKEMGAN